MLEDVILACLDSCFGSYKPLDRALIRVTRNADIDPDGEGVEEEEDYRQHMKRILKKRLRLQPVVARRIGLAREGNAQDHPQGARAFSPLGLYLRYPP